MRASKEDDNFYQRVYEVVRRIPRGKVVAYGWVASWLGNPRAARAVGYALAAAPDDVPWQRVINSRGEISVGGRVSRPEEQMWLLKKEGVVFNKEGVTDFRRFGYKPTSRWLARWCD